jgi:hypothetical protein
VRHALPHMQRRKSGSLCRDKGTGAAADLSLNSQLSLWGFRELSLFTKPQLRIPTYLTTTIVLGLPELLHCCASKRDGLAGIWFKFLINVKLTVLRPLPAGRSLGYWGSSKILAIQYGVVTAHRQYNVTTELQQERKPLSAGCPSTYPAR